MCDCIAKIEERVKREELVITAFFEHNQSQKSEVAYRPITQAGEESKHCRYTLIPWEYCPFCGEEIAQQK